MADADIQYVYSESGKVNAAIVPIPLVARHRVRTGDGPSVELGIDEAPPAGGE
jgi:hypothetical protein